MQNVKSVDMSDALTRQIGASCRHHLYTMINVSDAYMRCCLFFLCTAAASGGLASLHRVDAGALRRDSSVRARSVSICVYRLTSRTLNS